MLRLLFQFLGEEGAGDSSAIVPEKARVDFVAKQICPMRFTQFFPSGDLHSIEATGDTALSTTVPTG